MFKLVFNNFKLSLATMLPAMLLGFCFSFLINFFFNREPSNFLYQTLILHSYEKASIETTKLDEYNRTQGACIVSAAAIRFLIAQVVFIPLLTLSEVNK